MGVGFALSLQMSDTLRRLQQLGLLKRAVEPHEGDLRRLCDEGVLVGGVSVALDVGPDALFGLLTQAMGGQAPQLRIFDVRGHRPMHLEVNFQGTSETWEVEGIEALISHLNDFFRHQKNVKAVVSLGEWNDMLQVWCVEKKTLQALRQERLLF